MDSKLIIKRTYDVPTIIEAVKQYAERIVGFEPSDWTRYHDNIALCNDYGDVSLFERNSTGVVTGHYFFKSRGRDAVKVAKKMLEEVFKDEYDVRLIRGLTPLQNLGARWMNKTLGFKSYGPTKTEVDIYEIVILTKEEWLERNNHE